MVRNYIKKGKKKAWTEEQRTTALGLVEFHKNIAVASRLSGVPKSTLKDWVHAPNKPLGSGKTTVLLPWEEDDIITVAVYLGDEGFPMRREQVKDLVQSYILHTKQNTTKHPFGIKGRPDKD